MVPNLNVLSAKACSLVKSLGSHVSSLSYNKYRSRVNRPKPVQRSGNERRAQTHSTELTRNANQADAASVQAGSQVTGYISDRSDSFAIQDEHPICAAGAIGGDPCREQFLGPRLWKMPIKKETAIPVRTPGNCLQSRKI
jgi:hypothetical protein